MYGEDIKVVCKVTEVVPTLEDTKGNYKGSNTCMFCGASIPDANMICGDIDCIDAMGE